MSDVIHELYATIESRKINPPPGSYTARLFAAGPEEIMKKVGEEAIEVIVAAASQTDERLVSESADLVYHLLVLLADRGIEWSAVEAELDRRKR
ncbi:MAG: phosphoribosyl-ATP diphosphatase [Anaerolineae bacterium]